MFSIRILIVILFTLYAIPHQAQKRISQKEKKNVITSLKDVITSNYVFPDKAIQINRALDSLHALGKYKKISAFLVFADTLTNDLVRISKDKHFKLQYRPDLAQPRVPEKEADSKEEPDTNEERIDLNFWYAQKANFGFEKVEVLEGNIGYIKLTFFDVFEWVKPTMDAAMGFVSNTDALIIDLRGNNGGYNSATYLTSYFFNETPMLLNTSYNRAANETKESYTFEKVDGERYLDKPVYILVDEESFSRAEGFAYGMKHFKRATILGQTTPGAAHSIDFIKMENSFFIQVPVERMMHPITKTDWEGVGVIPDSTTSKEQTLNVAYQQALDHLISQEKNEALGIHHDKLMKKYEAIKEKINGQ